VQQRFRVSTKGKGLIQTGDHVMLALSGGAASGALLTCAADLLTTNTFRLQRGKVAYQLIIVHVDISGVAGGTAAVAAGARQQQLVQDAAAAVGLQSHLVVLKLQDLFAEQHDLQQLFKQQLGHQPVAPDTSAAMRAEAAEPEQQQQTVAAVGLGQAVSSTPAPGTSGEVAAGCPQTSSVCELHVSSSSCSSTQASSNELHLQRLLELLAAVDDSTGREDLVVHLTEALLLRAAAAAGCSRLLLGDCASRLAVRVIADAAKGRGFSLPADIQLLDARLLPEKGSGPPCVVRPLREVTFKELVQVCQHRGIAWSDHSAAGPKQQQQQQPAAPAAAGTGGQRGRGGSGPAAGGSVNALAEKFVDEMQQGLPASIYTIIKTASHLRPFGFNDVMAVPEAADFLVPPNVRQQQRLEQQQRQQGADGSSCGAHSQLCSICRAPLPGGDVADSSIDEAASVARLTLAGLTGQHSKNVCYSCNRQILYKVRAPGLNGVDGGVDLNAKMQRLKQLLPAGMLLCDDDAGT
jgi:hypothetical protein